MRELHGMAFVGHVLFELKRKALIFDTFHVWEPEEDGVDSADLDFLRGNGLIRDLPFGLDVFAGTRLSHAAIMEMFFVPELTKPNAAFNEKEWPPVPAHPIKGEIADCITRQMARWLVVDERVDVIPVYEQPVSEVMSAYQALGCMPGDEVPIDVVDIGTSMFPVPDDSTSWQDIIDFREASHDKLWHLPPVPVQPFDEETNGS